MEIPTKSMTTKRRPICQRCSRPTPSACICSSLPDTPIKLSRCDLYVVQHPHEQRRQNRSMPFVEFCIDPQNVHVQVARRLNVNDNLYRLLDKPGQPLWLIYPSPDAISLSQAMRQLEELEEQDRDNDCTSSPPLPPPSSSSSSSSQSTRRLSLLFIDATWKFAREMIRASTFPRHLQHVQLDAHDLKHISPRRFDIRTPLSDQHLSTAECIALILSRVEDNQDIYNCILRPLDLMVQQWHAFADQTSKGADQEPHGKAATPNDS